MTRNDSPSDGGPLIPGVELEEWDLAEKNTVTPNLSSPALSSLMNEMGYEAPAPGAEAEAEAANDIQRDVRPLSPNARERWSMSDDAPLLAEDGTAQEGQDSTTEGVEETAPEAPSQVKEKKSFISAEHKIAFSHFLVNKTKVSSVTQALMVFVEDILVLHQQ